MLVTVTNAEIFIFNSAYKKHKLELEPQIFGILNILKFNNFIKEVDVLCNVIHEQYLFKIKELQEALFIKHPSKKELLTKFLACENVVKANEFINEHNELNECIEDIQQLNKNLENFVENFNKNINEINITFEVDRFLQILEQTTNINSDFIVACEFLFKDLIK